MKYVLSVVLLSSIAVSAQNAANVQTGGSASATANATAQQPTVVPAVLNKSVDSKKAKVGDEVTAKVSNDVRTADGIVIPRGSKLVGKVTQANARAKGDGTSAIGLSFDRLALKDGRTLNLVSTIQAVVAAPQPAPAPAVDSMGEGSSGTSRGGYGGPSSGGPIGAVGSAAGGVAGDVANTAGTVAGNTVGGVAQAGSEPLITARTTGVIGIKNVEIQSSANASAGTVLTSDQKSVKLDGGTRFLVSVTSASARESESQPKK